MAARREVEDMSMRRLLFSIAVLVALAVAASAAPLCTDVLAANGGSFNVLTAGLGGYDPSVGCTFGSLTFSNFGAKNAGGVPTPAVFLNGISAPGGVTTLNFNPMLLNQNYYQDIYFWFVVTGPIGGIGLQNNGGPTGLTGIEEKACVTSASPDGTCVGGNLLADISAGSNENAQASFNSMTTYIWKDIGVLAGGHISSFNETFLPEPVSFVLLGTGLLGLGLVRRKVRKS
jgi:hypothetical protein